MCPTLQHVQAIPFLSGNMMSSEPIILGWFQHVSTRRSTIWSTAFHPIVIWFPRSLASGTSPSLCEPARLSDAAADLFFDPYLLPWKNSRNQYPPGNSGTWQWKMRPWKYWWSRNSIYMVGTCRNILEKVKILLPSSTSGGYTYRLYPKTSLATKCNDTIKLHCRDVCSWSTEDRRSVKMTRSYRSDHFLHRILFGRNENSSSAGDFFEPSIWGHLEPYQ